MLMMRLMMIEMNMMMMLLTSTLTKPISASCKTKIYSMPQKKGAGVSQVMPRQQCKKIDAAAVAFRTQLVTVAKALSCAANINKKQSKTISKT